MCLLEGLRLAPSSEQTWNSSMIGSKDLSKFFVGRGGRVPREAMYSSESSSSLIIESSVLVPGVSST